MSDRETIAEEDLNDDVQERPDDALTITPHEPQGSLGGYNTPPVAPPLTANQLRITDNLSQLLEILPPPLRAALEDEDSMEGLIEIVMDLGRDAEARFSDGRVVWIQEGIPITHEDIAFV